MMFVLVHGIHDTSRKVKVLQTALENQGHCCIAPSLTPNDGSKSLDYLAKQLQACIGAAIGGTNAKLALVGFSMGGLVARYYMQELGGYKQVSHFFSIASPHHGTVLAYLSAKPGARQMRPNSDFLKRLGQNTACLQNVACYSYWTPFDLMIVPATSSVWDQADNIRVKALCHPLMVKNSRIIADILQKVGD